MFSFMFLVDGGFGQWSSFTECSRTCGSGVKTRIRYCNSPEPRGISAKNCTGKFKEIRHCKLVPCVGRWFANSRNRSSRVEVFYEKGVHKNFANFIGKHLCQSLFFNKVAGLRSPTL